MITPEIYQAISLQRLVNRLNQYQSYCTELLCSLMCSSFGLFLFYVLTLLVLLGVFCIQ